MEAELSGWFGLPPALYLQEKCLCFFYELSIAVKDKCLLFLFFFFNGQLSFSAEGQKVNRETYFNKEVNERDYYHPVYMCIFDQLY